MRPRGENVTEPTPAPSSGFGDTKTTLPPALAVAASAPGEVQCTRQLRLGRHDIRQEELVGSKKLVVVNLARLAIMRLDAAKDRMPGILVLPATTW